MRTFLIILLIFLYCGISFSQSGWVWNHPKPQGHDLDFVQFINSQTGFAIGEKRVMLKTTDAGNTWGTINSESGPYIYKVDIVSENVFYMVTLNQTIIKSSDGGILWNEVFANNNYDILNIYFLSQNTGFAVGGDYNNHGFLMKTTTGGISWDTLISDTGYYSFNEINFINNNLGFIFGHSEILKTTNGGFNWYQVDSDDAGMMRSSFFLNQNTGYVSSVVIHSYHRMYKTTNGGENWFLISAEYPSYASGLHFIDETTGFAASLGVFKTTNGGVNWNYLETGFYYPSDFFFLNNKIIGAGKNGDLIYSVDEFSSYVPVSYKVTNNDLTDDDFINANTGYCISTSRVFATVNSGDNWALLSDFTGMSKGLRCIKFINESTGFLGGTSNNGAVTYGHILKTTTAGASWQPAYTGLIDYSLISAIEFNTNNTTGFAAGRGNVLKTTNQGLTWQNKTPPNSSSEDFFSISIQNNNILLTGVQGKLFHSSDGGETWFKYTSSFTAKNLYSSSFVNSLTGYISGDGSKILKTTTGGFNSGNWYSVSPSFDAGARYHEINFFNENTGYAMDVGGSIVMTTNGGANWEQQITDDRFEFNSMSFVNSTTGFLFGRDGAILKTTTGGTIGITNISLETPSSFRLHQNYPNPFNPSTIIRFDVPKNKEFAKLIIYDIAGREITKLVNQELSPGIYEYEFDGRGLSSGMYFYRLETNTFIETRKMVLVK